MSSSASSASRVGSSGGSWGDDDDNERGLTGERERVGGEGGVDGVIINFCVVACHNTNLL